MKIIPPFKLVAEPLTEEAGQVQGFKWAGEHIGNRHRLGGEPEFIQPGEIPVCHSCGSTRMTFYAQLDSIGDEHIIADCGMIYVFICFDCFDVKAFVQSM